MYSFKDLTYITIYDLLQENNSPLMVAYRAYAPIPSARSNDQYSRRHDTFENHPTNQNQAAFVQS
jgi:hypothetical protein